jgi:anthranilate synthase component 1
MSGPASPRSPSIDRAPLIQPISADSAALLALHASFPDRYPALFESAAAGNVPTRYDILFAYPQARLSLLGDGTLSGRTSATENRFLPALDQWWQSERTAPRADN